MQRIEFLKNKSTILGLSIPSKKAFKRHRKYTCYKVLYEVSDFYDGLKLPYNMQKRQILQLVSELENKHDNNPLHCITIGIT